MSTREIIEKIYEAGPQETVLITTDKAKLIEITSRLLLLSYPVYFKKQLEVYKDSPSDFDEENNAIAALLYFARKYFYNMDNGMLVDDEALRTRKRLEIYADAAELPLYVIMESPLRITSIDKADIEPVDSLALLLQFVNDFGSFDDPDVENTLAFIGFIENATIEPYEPAATALKLLYHLRHRGVKVRLANAERTIVLEINDKVIVPFCELPFCEVPDQGIDQGIQELLDFVTALEEEA